MATAQYSWMESFPHVRAVLVADPVFSTKANPFVEPRSPLGHYHPSPGKPLTQRARHTSLSPVRVQSLSPKAGVNAARPQAQRPGAHRDERPSERAPVAVRTAHSQPDPDSSDPFDESWPSTEQSSARTPEAVDGLAEREPVPPTRESVPPTREPVIARFVERFRHGRPTSRAEREMAERVGSGAFWWLQDPASEATKPTKRATDRLASGRSQPRSSSERSLGQRSSGRSGPSPASSSLERMRHRNNSDLEGDLNLSVSGLMDADTHSLQERANQLLERSESTLSSRAGAVSSEGLGSSRSSERNFSEPAPPPWGHLALLPPATDGPSGSTAPLVSLQPTLTTQLPLGGGTGSTPADDILYQWRLRRRMEEAREFGANVVRTPAVPSSDRELPRPTPWQHPRGVAPAGAEVPVTAEDAGRHKPDAPARFQVPVASPHIRCSTDTPGGPKESVIVAPHLHLSCDVLPCPHAPPTHHELRDERRPVHAVRVAPHGSHGGKEESRSDIRPRNLSGSTERSGKTGQPTTSKVASRSSKITAVNADDDRDGVNRHGMSGRDATCGRRSVSRPELAEQVLFPTAASAKRGHRETVTKPGRERHERRVSKENAGGAERREVGGAPSDRVPVRPEGARDGKKQREARRGKERVSACSDESPFSSTVGLVISERLFTPAELKRSKTNELRRVGDKGRVPRDIVTASQPRPPSSQPRPPSSAESELPSAVLCLLEQAEDSDGTDFPDDPLLKLLREQRNRIRDRLCETTRLISSLELTERPS